jgi:DNA-binding LacI/PurR family transcriptional regulator
MDGAIVYICDPASPDIAWLERRGVPMVWVDRDPSPLAPSVNVDDRGGARAAAQHVLDLGHRRVGIITLDKAYYVQGVPAENRPARERMIGWRETFEAGGVEPEVHAARYGPRLSVEPIAREVLSRPDRPTAVVCFSDAFAVTTMKVAEELGLRVPEDLSIVGYDDSPLATASRPQLTTVHQEVASKGHEAVRALVALMGPDRPDAVERILLPTSLVVRESTAPPPA